jgi:predicted AlkP superfamily phosphohydrolase/phosphomutase
MKKKRINYKKLAFILIIVASFISIIFYTCFIMSNSENINSDKMNTKILIIGIDGMDYKLVNKLISENKLPNLKKLSVDGDFLPLETSMPPHSPVAWTTISTGSNPGEHGIFDFIMREKGSYTPKLSLYETKNSVFGTKYHGAIKTQTFWQYLSQNNIPVKIIKWPMSFPPEEINGELLAGLGVPDIKGLLSGYSFYTENLSIIQKKPTDNIIKLDFQKKFVDTVVYGPKTQTNNEMLSIKAPIRIKKSDEKITLEIHNKSYSLKEKEWSEWIRISFDVDLFRKIQGTFKAYVSSVEPFNMFITTIQISPENPVVSISYPESFSKKMVDEIGLYYTNGMPEETGGYEDDRISKEGFLSQIDDIENERNKLFWQGFEEFSEWDKGVYAIVYDSSDRLQHMFWDENIFYENSSESSESYKVIEEYYKKKDDFVGTILDKIDKNTKLIIISDHGFNSFKYAININRILEENQYIKLNKDDDEDNTILFKNVDWSKSKAYSLGFNSVYINLNGREPEGIVSKENKFKIESEIINLLENYKDSKGNRIINKVYRANEIYNGESIESSPDLIIGFNKDYRMDNINPIGGFTKKGIYENKKKWKGDHLIDSVFVPGVFFSNKKINRTQIKQKDLFNIFVGKNE